MNYDRVNLRKVERTIYEVWQARFNKMYRDTDWHNVTDFVKVLQTIYGIEYIEMQAGKYFHYMDGSDVPPYREYEISVKTEFGYLCGYITCCAAGTMEDPFSMYDMLISVSPDDAKNKDI